MYGRPCSRKVRQLETVGQTNRLMAVNTGESLSFGHEGCAFTLIGRVITISDCNHKTVVTTSLSESDISL